MRINLVQGQGAGGLLRRACREFGLVGEVRVIDDDLSVGPLQDEQTRNEWWATVYGDHDPSPYQPNLYSQWRTTIDEIERDPVRELLIWSSNSARDYVLERMAAFMLIGVPNPISVLRVPASASLEGVGFTRPNLLATM